MGRVSSQIQRTYSSFILFLVVSVSLNFFGGVKAVIGRCKAQEVDGSEASVFDLSLELDELYMRSRRK